MSKIIVIDGNSLLFRSYYATYNPDPDKIMKNHDNIPTNALFAFSNMISNLLKELKKGDGIFVAFDAGKHTFRHKEFAEYKANRPPCPENLLIQMPIAREFLNSLNIKYYEDENIEADDIAGNIAKKAETLGYSVDIYTSDKDYLQLIDDKITIKLIKKGLKDIKNTTPQSFEEEWGFKPIQIVDYKGLMGDPSDNLKGIPKVGDKTAKKLIVEYKTLENIIENAPNFKSKVGESIVENSKNGLMCKHLAFIKVDDNLPINISDIIYEGYNFEKIKDFANKYDLRTLINKLPLQLRQKSIHNYKVSFKEINNDEINKIVFNKNIGLSVDIDNDNYHDATLLGILITTNDETYYISKENLKNNNVLSMLKNKEISKFCFDFKKIKYILNKNDIQIDGLYFDLLLASYLLNSSLKPNVESVLTNFGIDISYAYQNDSLFSNSNPIIAAIESFYSLSLYDDVINKLKEKDQYDLLINMEQPLALVLEEMEYEGFPLDANYLKQLGEGYKEKIKELEEEIFNLAGEKFNVSSPKQVSSILFDKLNLPSNKKYSTSFEYLKDIQDEHPIIGKILEYRKYNKLLTTYVDGLIPFIHNDGKIHATFNQALTTTGRLSSSEPNLQNISVRDNESKLIRKAFHYNEDNLNILSLDYSQIELRILAHLSNSQTLIDVFNSDEDIHAATAKKVFKVDGELDPALRRKAKAVNFGIIYGISDWGLSEQLDISLKESKEIIESFYKEFPEIKTYLNSLVQSAQEKGYATTMFNRRRYIPELNSSEYQKREFAKRAAMNAPIQGSAADLIKIAMINVSKTLKEYNLKAKIISQIHDEIILKVSDNEKDVVYNLVKNTMEQCVKLKVKLKVDGGYGKSWFDAK